jgi:hypothetical protein
MLIISIQYFNNLTYFFEFAFRFFLFFTLSLLQKTKPFTKQHMTNRKVHFVCLSLRFSLARQHREQQHQQQHFVVVIDQTQRFGWPLTSSASRCLSTAAALASASAFCNRYRFSRFKNANDRTKTIALDLVGESLPLDGRDLCLGFRFLQYAQKSNRTHWIFDFQKYNKITDQTIDQHSNNNNNNTPDVRRRRLRCPAKACVCAPGVLRGANDETNGNVSIKGGIVVRKRLFKTTNDERRTKQEN